MPSLAERMTAVRV